MNFLKKIFKKEVKEVNQKNCKHPRWTEESKTNGCVQVASYEKKKLQVFVNS